MADSYFSNYSGVGSLHLHRQVIYGIIHWCRTNVFDGNPLAPPGHLMAIFTGTGRAFSTAVVLACTPRTVTLSRLGARPRAGATSAVPTVALVSVPPLLPVALLCGAVVVIHHGALAMGDEAFVNLSVIYSALVVFVGVLQLDGIHAGTLVLCW